MSHLETLVQRMTNASALDEDSEICEKKTELHPRSEFPGCLEVQMPELSLLLS